MKFNSLFVLPFINHCLADLSLKDSRHKLIQLSESEAPKLLSPEQHLSLLESGKHFVDRTYQEPSTERSFGIIPITKFPTKAQFKTQVEAIEKRIDITRAKEFLTELNGFCSRYCETPITKDAALYIKDYVRDIIGTKIGINIEEFAHQWGQPSLIVRFNGTKLPNETVILGANIGSISQEDPAKGNSPNAGDDGSGKILELQFFSGKEARLSYSQQIAQKYKMNKKKVYSMLKQDIVGYKTATNNQTRVVNDAYINQGFAKFVKLLITSYTKNPVGEYKCGYACSDHASYTGKVYPLACLFEAKFSPVYHTKDDTIDYIDFGYFKVQPRVSL